MKTKTIRQVINFKASPHDIYEMLMDSKKHARIVGSTASISRKIGGKISVYDGDVEGTNLELVPDEKIVQTWRMGDWPEGHFSKAAFALKAVDSGTMMTFTQNDIPEEVYEDIKQGWHDYYWEPMKELIKKK
jgi:activator of HSP90 ATPase